MIEQLCRVHFDPKESVYCKKFGQATGPSSNSFIPFIELINYKDTKAISLREVALKPDSYQTLVDSTKTQCISKIRFDLISSLTVVHYLGSKIGHHTRETYGAISFHKNMKVSAIERHFRHLKVFQHLEYDECGDFSLDFSYFYDYSNKLLDIDPFSSLEAVENYLLM